MSHYTGTVIFDKKLTDREVDALMDELLFPYVEGFGAEDDAFMDYIVHPRECAFTFDGGGYRRRLSDIMDDELEKSSAFLFVDREGRFSEVGADFFHHDRPDSVAHRRTHARLRDLLADADGDLYDVAIFDYHC